MSRNDNGEENGNSEYSEHQQLHGKRPTYGALRGPGILAEQQLWYYDQSLKADSLPEAEEKYHRVFHKDSYAANLVNEFFNYFRRNKLKKQYVDRPSPARLGEDIDFQIIVNEISQTLDEYELRVLAYVLNRSGLIQYLGDLSSIPKLRPSIERALRENPMYGKDGAIFVRNQYQYYKAAESLKQKITDRFPDLYDWIAEQVERKKGI